MPHTVNQIDIYKVENQSSGFSREYNSSKLQIPDWYNGIDRVINSNTKIVSETKVSSDSAYLVYATYHSQQRKGHMKCINVQSNIRTIHKTMSKDDQKHRQTSCKVKIINPVFIA